MQAPSCQTQRGVTEVFCGCFCCRQIKLQTELSGQHAAICNLPKRSCKPCTRVSTKPTALPLSRRPRKLEICLHHRKAEHQRLRLQDPLHSVTINFASPWINSVLGFFETRVRILSLRRLWSVGGFSLSEIGHGHELHLWISSTTLAIL